MEKYTGIKTLQKIISVLQGLYSAKIILTF
jgi:hypothetical protein